jgi:methionine transaminase
VCKSKGVNAIIFALMLPFKSKLPAVGDTIFSTMSALALKHQAINLGQGFADYSMNHELGNLVHKYILADKNQYAPMPGVPELRQVLQQKILNLYAHTCSADTDITVTPGGTYGIYTALSTIINTGDEAIVLEPAYDSYVPNIISNGGVPVLVSLEYPNFAPNWQKISQAITTKTKAIIINTPNNPGGYCFTPEDWQSLADLVAYKNITVISDEVYEHIVLDNKPHESILKHAEKFEHYFAVFSFGKVFHNTGWKLGYVVAPTALSIEFRKLHQFIAFTCNTPVQYALAEFMQDASTYTTLPKFFEQKRNLLVDGLTTKTNLKVLAPAQGSFFQTASYAHLSNESDANFCIRLTQEFGVTCIPVSAFYQHGVDNKLIRLCFAKKEETLNAAIEKLAQL